MIYYLLKFSMIIALRLFYKKIYFVNVKNIPAKGPVILASMHPNSFIDDFTLGAFLKRELRFLARGDVFKGKIARILLEQMFVSPIYRAADNPKDVKKNTDAFKEYAKILKRNGTILMHPEGICVHEKRVRKLRKGTARIAFGAEEEYDFSLGVQIVPVSMNYTNGPKPREDLMVEFSKPIPISEYKELYEENPQKAYQAINERIYSALVERAVVIEEKAAEQLTEHYLRLLRNDINIPMFPIYSHDPKRFELEKEASVHINDLYKHKLERFLELNESANSYFNELKNNDIYDRDIANKAKYSFVKALFLVFTLPLFVIGYVGNILPVYIGKKLANKVVKTIEFYASVFVGASWLCYLIYISILLIIGYQIAGIIGLDIVFIVALLGFFSVQYQTVYLEFISYLKFKSFKSKNSDKAEQLYNQRIKLLNSINGAL